MGVLGRINDIIRSNLNELVSKAENPEKLLKQAILDMEEHLRTARKQVLDTIAAEKTLEKKRLQLLEGAKRWERRAELALGASDEELATQALARAADAEVQAGSMEAQIKVQREYVGALKQSLTSLEERLRDARARKDALLARAKAARARQQTSAALGLAVAGKSSKESRAFDLFDRMEDRVLEIESQVEAYEEMAAPGQRRNEDVELDARFHAMERSSGLEARLKKLKAQVATKPGAAGNS